MLAAKYRHKNRMAQLHLMPVALKIVAAEIVIVEIAALMIELMMVMAKNLAQATILAQATKLAQEMPQLFDCEWATQYLPSRLATREKTRWPGSLDLQYPLVN
jgi:hypothetical protein